MYTPGQVLAAEEQIHAWHIQSSRRGDSKHATSDQGPSRLAALWSRLRGSAASNALESGDGVIAHSSGIPVEALLQAVARGELSPRAAHAIVQGRISTLALLQAVAWGEISPNAARHLLAQQV